MREPAGDGLIESGKTRSVPPGMALRGIDPPLAALAG